MKRLYGVSWLVVVMHATMVSAAEPAPLRLVGSADGREFADFRIERGELYLRDANGGELPTPRGVTWRLEGSLAEHWQRVYFFPRFRVVTRGAIDATPEVRTRTHGLVWLHREQAWAQAQTADGVIVIAWLVDGAPVWVEAMPAHVPQMYSAGIIAVAARELDSAEVRGSPVVLLWRNGEFVAPFRLLKNLRMSGLAAALHLASLEEFERTLAEASPRGIDDQNDLALIVGRAAEGPWPERLEKLIAAGGRYRDSWRPPLSAAAANGRAECVRVLLAAGVSPADQGKIEWLPVDWALGRGHLDAGMLLLSERDRRQRYRALQVALEQGSVDHVRALFERIGKVRWKNVPEEALASARHLGDPELVQVLATAGAGVPAGEGSREAATNGKPLFAASEIDVTPTLTERARLTSASHWQYDGSSGFGLLARPDRELESPWDPPTGWRLWAVGISGQPVGMWAAASIIVEPDGRASMVQMIDGISEPFAQAVERMLKASAFLPGERNGEPVRSRFTLMVLAD